MALTSSQIDVLRTCSKDEVSFEKLRNLCEALAHKASFFEEIVEKSPDIVACLDDRMRYIYVNQVAERAFNLPRTAFLGKTPAELNDLPGLKDTRTSGLEAVLETGEANQHEFIYEDGTERHYYEVRRCPLYDDNQKIKAVLTYTRDVTRRAQAEAAQRTSEERFRILVNSIEEVVFTLDMEQRFTGIYGYGFEYLGKKVEDFLGKTTREIAIPQYAAFFEQQNLRVLAGEKLVYDWVDELERHIQTSLSPLYNTEGEIVGIAGVNRDFSNVRKIEEALDESRHFAEQIIQTMPGVVFIFDMMQQRNVYINQEIKRVLGYTPEQMKAMSFEHIEQVFHPDDVAFWLSNADSYPLQENNEPYENEYRFRNAAGEWRWLSVRTVVFRHDADGSPSQLLGIAQDITPRKEMEEALRTNEKHFRLLINSVDDVFFTLNREQRYTSIHGIWLEKGGYTAASFLGRTARDLFGEADAQVHEEANTRTLAGEHVVYEWQGPSGYMQTSLSPLRDNSGAIIGIVGVGRNITPLKQLENALRQSNKQFNNLVDNLPGMAYSVRTFPDGWVEVQYLSPHCEVLHGYTADILSRNLKLLYRQVHPDDFLHFREVAGKAAAEVKPAVWEGRFVVNDEVRWRQFNSQPELLDDGSILWQGLETDITDQKAAEAALREQERLTGALYKEHELSELRGNMMMRIAHEFRTPLSVILASYQMLHRYYDRIDQEMLGNHLVKVQNATRRLTDMLDAIAAVMNSQLEPFFAPLDIGQLCQRVVADAQGAGGQQHQLKLMLDRQTRMIIADENLIGIMLVNLLSNAFLYSDPGTVVTLSLASGDDDSVDLRITDQGRGLSEREQVYVFEPFFRGSNSRETAGIGLGLTLTQIVVNLHRGKINFESQQTTGTTVTVSLPITQPNISWQEDHQHS